MKKMIFILVAMFAAAIGTFAETKKEAKTDNIAVYNIDIKINALCVALQLNEDQKETVTDFHNTFCMEMLVAGNAEKSERKKLVDHAVENAVSNMSYILTKEQYDKYVTILNNTLYNRGLR
ncbi:MAG: hypothetical protein J1E57_00345 [Prevotella sp.]|nr:hypothetical protein [Prevotella sp.]